MHHKLRHQQPLNLLDFQQGLLVQDKIHMIHNHTYIHLHIVILPLIFQLTQMKWYKMKLKIKLLPVILLLFFHHLQRLFLIIHELQLDLYMILHHFLLLFSSRINQFNQKIIIIETNKNSSQHYDPFKYSFFPPSNTNIQTNNTQNVSLPNNTNLMTQHPYAHLLQTKSSQSNFPLQNQRTSYSNIVQPHQRRSQNPPLSHIPTDPLYQMNQHTTYNPTTISPPVNMIQPVVPPLQYMPMQHDTFIITSASIPEPMNPFDGLDHSNTPEECLKQIEARLSFAIGKEPQNNPINYRSWHNRRMAY